MVCITCKFIVSSFPHILVVLPSLQCFLILFNCSIISQEKQSCTAKTLYHQTAILNMSPAKCVRVIFVIYYVFCMYEYYARAFSFVRFTLFWFNFLCQLSILIERWFWSWFKLPVHELAHVLYIYRTYVINNVNYEEFKAFAILSFMCEIS